jgi:hypothetical protein
MVQYCTVQYSRDVLKIVMMMIIGVLLVCITTICEYEFKLINYEPHSNSPFRRRRLTVQYIVSTFPREFPTHNSTSAPPPLPPSFSRSLISHATRGRAARPGSSVVALSSLRDPFEDFETREIRDFEILNFYVRSSLDSY